MEANGGSQVVAKTVWTESQHGNQFGQSVAWPAGKVSIAGICAPDVGAKGTAAAGRVLFKSEPVLLFLTGLGLDTRDRLFLNRLQRITCSVPANHGRGQFLGLCRVAIRLLKSKLPKQTHVLLQLAQHQIGPIAAKVFFPRYVLCCRQIRSGVVGIEQRPIGIFSVLVAIPEQKLPEGDDIAVVKLRVRNFEALVPINLRLADAVREAEWFYSAEIVGLEKFQRIERVSPGGALRSLHEGGKGAGLAEEHNQQ